MINMTNQTFDLAALLRLGSLDIRGVASLNPSLSVREYFNALSEFMDFAPEIADALIKTTNLKGDESALKTLAGKKKLLESMGGGRYVPDIDEVLDAGKENDAERAAAGAKKLANDFIRLHAGLKTAVKKTGIADIINYHDVSNDSREVLSAEELLIDESEERPLKSALDKIDEEDAGRKLRILAVDDTALVLKTVVATLGDDYKVYTLSKSTMVEDFLKQIVPDLILLDYKMPDLSGFDLISIIRKFPEHKDTPVIFLTSMDTGEYINTAISLGASGYIIKPFQRDVLREKVAKCIVKKKLN